MDTASIVDSNITKELTYHPGVALIDQDNKTHLVQCKGIKRTGDVVEELSFQMLDSSIKSYRLQEILALYTVNKDHQWKLLYSNQSLNLLQPYVGHVVDLVMQDNTVHKNVLFAEHESGLATFLICEQYHTLVKILHTKDGIREIRKSAQDREYVVRCYAPRSSMLENNIYAPPATTFTRFLYMNLLSQSLAEVEDNWSTLDLALPEQTPTVANDYWYLFPQMTPCSCLDHWRYIIHQIVHEQKTPVLDKCLSYQQKSMVGLDGMMYRECVGALYHLARILMKYKTCTIGVEFKKDFTVCLDNLLIYMKKFAAQHNIPIDKAVFNKFFWFPVLRNVKDLNWIIKICICYPDLFDMREEQYNMVDSSKVGRDTLSFFKKACSPGFDLIMDYVYPELLHPIFIAWQKDINASYFRTIVDLIRRGIDLNITKDTYWARTIMLKHWSLFASCAVAGMKYDAANVAAELPKLMASHSK